MHNDANTPSRGKVWRALVCVIGACWVALMAVAALIAIGVWP